MSKFRIIFEGRKVGSIGIFSIFSVEVMAYDFDEARLKLYDEFEHVRVKIVNKVKAL